jgi:hypothetical protein
VFEEQQVPIGLEQRVFWDVLRERLRISRREILNDSGLNGSEIMLQLSLNAPN